MNEEARITLITVGILVILCLMTFLVFSILGSRKETVDCNWCDHTTNEELLDSTPIKKPPRPYFS